MKKILIVDDEENLRFAVKTLLLDAGYETMEADCAEKAIDLIEPFLPDFILTDVRMPGMSGVDFLQRIKSKEIETPIIVMSAYGNLDLALEAIRLGASDYIQKPFRSEELIFLLRKIEERGILQRENRELRSELIEGHTFENMVSKNALMQDVFYAIEKVSIHKTTVLIMGESGVGKELVAKAIHQKSKRKGLLIAINCAAIPEQLLESELFGYKRGAFTDAKSDHSGLFEQANGGTLFLDEISELSPSLQAKLLRVLQEEVVHRLGDNKEIPIDVRIVAATNRILEDQVKQGQFRNDLYYRLQVFSIDVPPLRYRLEDVPLLIDLFIQKHNSKLGTQIEGIDPAVRNRLMKFSWPGNIRQLENVIERAMVMTDGRTLQNNHFPSWFKDESHSKADIFRLENLSIKQSTRELEERLIRKALEQTNWNRTHAAILLEISLRSLLYKMKEFSIEQGSDN